MGEAGSVDDHLESSEMARSPESIEEAEGAGYLPCQGRMMAMIIPPTLKPENVKRLVDIGNRLYILNLIDHWSREERKEYTDLIAEREKIRREQ
uniref:Uncharacterized protein n=1 Tax=viral metagenome TaxID=1070528 RepID=A0A6M3ISL4_9ZZZZ